MQSALPLLSPRFLAALSLARELHGRQRRPGTRIPFMAHLLVVTGLVLEDGGDETEAIAALLHDAVEGGGDRAATLARIRAGFGARVAEIVERCSDVVDDDDGRPWVARKQAYLAHLEGEHDPSVLRVALADKVHNARSIVRDHREEGEALWRRFERRTPYDQLWFYSGLLKLFAARCDGPLVEDLRRAVIELGELSAADQARDREALRLWVDHDFHARPAPAGWIQVPTARQAIALLATGRVEALSCASDLEGAAAVFAASDDSAWTPAGELDPPAWTHAGGTP